MEANTNGTERQNAAGTGGWSHGIVPESIDGDCLTVLPDIPERTLRIPLRIAPSEHGHGYHNDESRVYCGYWETGELMDVQDTWHGKTLYPPKVNAAPMEGRYDNLRVYFVRAETGQIKIGIATRPVERLGSLQTGSPVKLTLICDCEGGRPQEREYHRQFAAHRLHGEWFAPHPDILAEIERLADAP